MRSNTDVGVRTRERTFEISLVFSKQWTNEREKIILLLNVSTDVEHYSCGNNSKHLLEAYREPMKTKFWKQQHPSWWTNKIQFVFSLGGCFYYMYVYELCLFPVLTIPEEIIGCPGVEVTDCVPRWGCREFKVSLLKELLTTASSLKYSGLSFLGVT